MTTVEVNPGICGLKSKIKIQSADTQEVTVTIESECQSIKAMEADLSCLDAYSICFAKFSQSIVYQSAEKNFKHAACPVPTAIIKGIEVASGLALPKDVLFVIKSE